ncbi:unnamed protein product [Paramecium primaurelia]|uniref:G domain-containing protein n=1 Tax=Paramecium primaurelia TaxID=5886 RepID=A0A8S1QHM2_PARPR|nr:unnamed protein product [Paramecium primaurelia]
MAKRQIVLTGFLGSGKTTLFNLICNSNQPVRQGGNSLTRQTFLKEAAYGSGFRVLDTPGYGAKAEKIIHAVGILNALSEGPVSQIFLIVKWERIEFMQDYLKSMVVKFRRFKHLLTAAVTHWDTADKEKIKIDQEQFIILCKGFGIDSVIFVSKFDSGYKVCTQIDTILNKCQAEKIELTEAEFYSNFDLIELKQDIELELEFQKENVNNKFRKIALVIREFIINFNEANPSMYEVMHYLALETKNIAEKIISDFEIQNNDSFSKLFQYHSNPSLAYLRQKKLLNLPNKKMKGDKNHFFNFIKACPFCNTIWLKVAGCGGVTTCGEFPVKDEYFNNFKMPLKYEFTITEKGITYKINEKYKQNEEKIKKYKNSESFWFKILQNQSPSSQIYHQPLKEKRKGCGKPIVWDEIPALSGKQLKELIDPGLMDYFVQEVPKEELKKTLMKAQKSVQDQVEIMKKENKVYKL